MIITLRATTVGLGPFRPCIEITFSNGNTKRNVQNKEFDTEDEAYEVSRKDVLKALYAIDPN